MKEVYDVGSIFNSSLVPGKQWVIGHMVAKGNAQNDLC